MSIVLSPEVEQQIEELVRSGRFESADHAVRNSLKLMQEHDEQLNKRKDELKRRIEQGLRDLEEGRFQVYDEAGLKELVEEIRREGRARLGLPVDAI